MIRKLLISAAFVAATIVAGNNSAQAQFGGLQVQVGGYGNGFGPGNSGFSNGYNRGNYGSYYSGYGNRYGNSLVNPYYGSYGTRYGSYSNRGAYNNGYRYNNYSSSRYGYLAPRYYSAPFEATPCRVFVTDKKIEVYGGVMKMDQPR